MLNSVLIALATGVLAAPASAETTASVSVANAPNVRGDVVLSASLWSDIEEFTDFSIVVEGPQPFGSTVTFPAP